MPFFSRLFGKPAAPKDSEPVLHKDCRIYPAPIKEASGYRVAARIEKEVGAAVRTHNLVRADTHAAEEDAAAASVAKARQAIDQLGDELFR